VEKMDQYNSIITELADLNKEDKEFADTFNDITENLFDISVKRDSEKDPDEWKRIDEKGKSILRLSKEHVGKWQELISKQHTLQKQALEILREINTPAKDSLT